MVFLLNSIGSTNESLFHCSFIEVMLLLLSIKYFIVTISLLAKILNILNFDFQQLQVMRKVECYFHCKKCNLSS